MTNGKRSKARERVRIGCSGYDYREWKGVFYPEDIPKREWLGYYADRFDVLEVNATYYNRPREPTLKEWKQQATTGFEYALKMSRFGSHNKKLKDPHDWLDNFTGPIKALGARLGPILVQLPPGWKPDPERLRGFLEAAPSRFDWAFEFRDERWLNDEVYSVLEDAGAALVWHDLIDDHPRELTAGFVYVRYHGPDAQRKKYAGSYPHQALSRDAKRFAELARQGTRVYAFFNNDQGGCAPKDAARLRDYVDKHLTG